MEIKRRKLNNTNDHKEEKDQDRLSALDDELLVTILSHLPIKITIAMSILSHRWRTIWTKLTSLRIAQENPMQKDIIATSYDLLSRPTATTIDAFEFIDITPPSNKEKPMFDKLLRRVSDRQVKELHISFGMNYSWSKIMLPNCVLKTQSLVVLKLGKLVVFDVPKNGIYLPNLRELHLWGCDFSYHELMNNDLSESFPLLEELHLSGSLPSLTKHYLRISASNLKVLTMDHSAGRCDPDSFKNKPSEVDIDAPNLRHFSIKGEAWLTPHFENPPIYLSTAYIFLGFWWVKPRENQIRTFEVIEPLYNAKFLDMRGDVYNGSIERWLDDSVNLPVFDQLTIVNFS